MKVEATPGGGRTRRICAQGRIRHHHASSCPEEAIPGGSRARAEFTAPAPCPAAAPPHEVTGERRGGGG
jgi:hypothetical protein